MRCVELQFCGGKSLQLTGHHIKPNWSALLCLDSQCSPWWYRESQEREEKRLWDEAMGDGFYDWYVAEVLGATESAREGPRVQADRAAQLFFPFMSAARSQAGSFSTDSF